MADFQNNAKGNSAVETPESAIYPDALIDKEKKFMNPDEIASYFLPGGGVEKAFGEGYEFRKEQQSVTREITSAFNTDSISLLEAPTGIGKTLSYLLPSAKWALLNGERVVISTNTINLQDQIVSKDIPLLREVLGENVKHALVKGMRNYLCLLRAQDVKSELGEGLLSEKAGAGEAQNILEWVQTTENGSLSDMGFTPSEQQWDKFAAESESCVRKECPYYNECFFFKARRKIAKANLIVVNHHLLFSDISIKRSAGRGDIGVLPPVRRIVIDEAHNIVDSATSHFTLRVSNRGILKTLNRLKRTAARSARIVKKTHCIEEKSPVVKMLSAMEKVFLPRIKKAETTSRSFFDSLHVGFMESSEDRGAPYRRSVRVTDTEIAPGKRWGRSASLSLKMNESVTNLSNSVREGLSILSEARGDERTVGIVADLKAVFTSLARHCDAIRGFSDTGSAEFVKSIEAGGAKRKKFAAVSISPIDIAPELKERLYDNCKTLIMTSATLRERGSFQFQKRSLGLDESERTTELAVPSPFDYRRQALLVLPTDIEEPSATESYIRKLSGAVFDFIRVSGGGALVLFTSYQDLEKVSSSLAPRLEKTGIKSLTQGDAPREKLLADFKNDQNAVLFGTDSFREGVDIAGDALRLVAITRLPFNVPKEPVFQARMEAIRNIGKDAFSEYAVPISVIHFRQAFGRLIRTVADTGVVAVLDSRIVRKPYGKRFIESIPQCRVAKGGMSKVIGDTEDFFRQNPRIS